MRLTVDGVEFVVEPNSLALRSQLIACILEGGGTDEELSSAIQSAWDAARFHSERSELDFQSLVTALKTGKADRSVTPNVLDYFGCTGVSLPCLVLTREKKWYRLPLHALNDVELMELTHRPRNLLECGMTKKVYDMETTRFDEIVQGCEGHTVDMEPLHDSSWHVELEAHLLCGERTSEEAAPWVLPCMDDRPPRVLSSSL